MATPTDTRPEARTRIRDWFYHFAVFLFVGAILVILDVQGGTGATPILGMDWAYWVLLPWGFAVAAHLVYAVFGDD